MSTNKQGQRLISLVSGWNRTLTVAEAAARKRLVSSSRQSVRRAVFISAFDAVNKADAERCQMPFELPQTRKERRNLARAYAKRRLPHRGDRG